MTLQRHNPKRDGTEAEIVETLRAFGFQVIQVSGKGLPDLLLLKYERAWMVEVKSAKGKLTPAQQRLRETWQGPPIAILRSRQEAEQWARTCLRG